MADHTLATVDSIMSFLMYPFLFLSIYFQVFMLSNYFGGKKLMHIEDKLSKNYDQSYTPTVSFLIPCWNEGKTLASTLDSVIALKYPKDKIKIYIINDGSTDNTLAIAQNYKEQLYKNKVLGLENITNKSCEIFILNKENGGKHTALNMALPYVDTELVTCLDADSFVDHEAMIIAVQYFKDQNVKGLASCMQIKDTSTWIHKIQRIEYLLSIFWKKSYSTIDAIQVVPGPFSIFRKSVFDDLGNYKPAHNAEDLEMTMRMHKHNYKIVNAHRAYVYTLGPDTLKGLIRQRVRWMRGFLDNAWDYREMFFKKKYGHFGLFTLPISTVFVFYVVFAISYTVYKTIVSLFKRYEEISIIGFRIPFNNLYNIEYFYINTSIMLFIVVFTLTVLSFVIFTSKQIAKDERPLIKHLILYFFIYPFIVPIFTFKAVFGFLIRSKNKWILQDNKPKYFI